MTIADFGEAQPCAWWNLFAVRTSWGANATVVELRRGLINELDTEHRGRDDVGGGARDTGDLVHYENHQSIGMVEVGSASAILVGRKLGCQRTKVKLHQPNMM